jgi:Spy/CpxP family protein refolding chaperone
VFSFKNEEHRIMIEFAYGFLLARRTLVLAAVLVASCGAIWAQADGQASPPTNGPAPGEMHRRGPGVERELAQLTHVLSLSAEQQTQVKALLTAQRQQFEALRNPSAANGSSNEAAPPSREQMEAIRQGTDSKIAALLNDDQKTKFAAWQQQRKQRMQRRRGPDSQPDNQGAPNPNAAGE